MEKVQPYRAPTIQLFDHLELDCFALQGLELFPTNLLQQFEELNKSTKPAAAVSSDYRKYPLLVQKVIRFAPFLSRCEQLFRDPDIDLLTEQDCYVHISILEDLSFDDCILFFCFAYLSTYGKEPPADLCDWASAERRSKPQLLLAPSDLEIKGWLRDPDLLSWLESGTGDFPAIPKAKSLLEALGKLLESNSYYDCSISQTMHNVEATSLSVTVDTKTWQLSIEVEHSCGESFDFSWYKTLLFWKTLSTLPNRKFLTNTIPKSSDANSLSLSLIDLIND